MPLWVSGPIATRCSANGARAWLGCFTTVGLGLGPGLRARVQVRVTLRVRVRANLSGAALEAPSWRAATARAATLPALRTAADRASRTQEALVAPGLGRIARALGEVSALALVVRH